MLKLAVLSLFVAYVSATGFAGAPLGMTSPGLGFAGGVRQQYVPMVPQVPYGGGLVGGGLLGGGLSGGLVGGSLLGGGLSGGLLGGGLSGGLVGGGLSVPGAGFAGSYVPRVGFAGSYGRPYGSLYGAGSYGLGMGAGSYGLAGQYGGLSGGLYGGQMYNPYRSYGAGVGAGSYGLAGQYGGLSGGLYGSQMYNPYGSYGLGVGRPYGLAQTGGVYVPQVGYGAGVQGLGFASGGMYGGNMNNGMYGVQNVGFAMNPYLGGGLNVMPRNVGFAGAGKAGYYQTKG